MKHVFTFFILFSVFNICHSQNNTWTWVNGYNFSSQRGVYGTKGQAAATNIPGARGASVTWKDKSGNFWMFGGLGFDINGNQGFLNDLWKWDGTNWTWVSGNATANPTGSYGSKGVTDPSNLPPAKTNSVGWIDANNNLWVFGGQGNTSNYMNDLWKWDGTNWTWVSGNSAANTAGVYGTKGFANNANLPGSRESSMAWIDNSGNFWLFGGDNPSGAYNDFWKWDGANWTWINGGTTAGQNGVYGTLGTAAGTNQPGGRNLSACWKDTSGNFWLFGGYGFPAGTGAYQPLNDLWKWDGTNWTWMSGGGSGAVAGNYGAKNVAVSTNIPGSRWGAANWVDSKNNFWMFGGHGRDASGYDGILNDLWKWDGTNWTWISGANSTAVTGVYGTKGTASSSNTPGARADAFGWTDNVGNLYLFGGFYWDDLWKFDLSSSVLPVAITSFSGSLVNTKAALRWNTATEINNKGFYVEKSVDGNNFYSIGFVTGHGTVNQTETYTYTDSFPLSGKTFYRLKQTDLDENFTYSNIIELTISSINKLSIYPNPAKDYIIISTTKINNNNFKIFDLSGKLIKTGTVNSNNTQVDISNLSVATYIFKMGDESILFIKE